MSAQLASFVLAAAACVTSLCIEQSECEAACRKPRLLNSQDLPVEIEQAALQRQFDALARMDLEILSYSWLGPVDKLAGRTGIVLPADFPNRQEGESADDLVLLLKDILLANGTESFRVGEEKGSHRGSARLYWQSIRGLPVFNGFIGLEFDNQTREVLRLVGKFVPDRALPEKPELTSEWARQQAIEIVANKRLGCMPGVIAVMEEPVLGYFVDSTRPNPPKLVWVVRMNPDFDKVYLNAVTGLLLWREPTSSPIVGCNPQ